MEIKFISFGIKYGIPKELDTFLDVRVLPNPFWIDELKNKTGSDQEAIDYMMSFPIATQTLDSLCKYLENLFTTINDKKDFYMVGLMCTGGRHRSVFVANYLTNYFSTNYKTSVFHRDTPELNENEK